MPSQALPLIVNAKDFAQSLQQRPLADHVQVIDLSSEAEFIQGHIANALHLPYASLLSGAATAPGKLADLSQLQQVFQSLGHREDTHYVVCDDEGGGWAGRFIWTLDMIGHAHYSYLDGGMRAWKALGLDTVSGTAARPSAAAGCPPLTLHPEPRRDLTFIMQGLGKQQFVIWDARSPEEYHGHRGNASKRGHIPGAINVEWTELMAPEQGYVIRKDARALLETQGLDGSTPIITHCQSHHRSGFTYLVGKHLGFEISAYDGSWSEWGNHPQTPVAC